MNVSHFVEVITTSSIIALLLTVIQITPIKINPWTFLLKILKLVLKSFGKALNSDVIDKIDTMKNDIDDLKSKIGDIEQVTNNISGMNEQLTGVKNDIDDLKSKIGDMEQVTNNISGMKEQLKEMKTDISDVRKTVDEGNIIAARQRILRFADEVMIGTPHSKGCYDQILADVDTYNNYCKQNVGFKNHITQDNITLIEKKYMDHLEHNDFLK